jgi:arylsulfatase A-like enzyme
MTNLLIFTTLALVASTSLLSAADTVKRPNVLFILMDDLGYSDLGCYGGEVPTPNIDSLGKGGLRFTQMSNSARCCPSRASLLTGLTPAQAGIPNMGGNLNEQCVTLASVLSDAGYSTYAVGKWHVGNTPTSNPIARGFSEFYGFPADHSQDQWTASNYVRLPKDRTPEVQPKAPFFATDVFNNYAVEFIKQGQASKKPWMLYLAHSAPHFPLQAPAESVTPLLDTYRKGWDVLRAERFDRLKKIGLVNSDVWKLTERSMVPVEKNDAIANGFGGKPNPAWNSLPKDRREDLARRMATYAAMVGHVDAGVGRILAHLKASGELDNTLIFITSDNGACYEWGPFGFDDVSRKGTTTLHTGAAWEEMGGPGTHMAYGSAWANLCNTPFRMYKHFTHEGGIISPMIVHWPAGVQAPGRWVRDQAHVMDIMATLVDVTHSPYPKQSNGQPIQPMEGLSLAPTFKANGTLAQRSICYQHEGARAIKKGNWKLLMSKRQSTEPTWELYDLTKDPCETTNLAGRHPEIVKSLVAEWDEWADRTGALSGGKKGAGKKGKNAGPKGGK